MLPFVVFRWRRMRRSKTKPAKCRSEPSGIQSLHGENSPKFAANTSPDRSTCTSKGPFVPACGKIAKATSGNRMRSLPGTCRCFHHPQTATVPSQPNARTQRHKRRRTLTLLSTRVPRIIAFLSDPVPNRESAIYALDPRFYRSGPYHHYLRAVILARQPSRLH